MLLNVVRVINSGWNLRLFADCTYKPCHQAIALMVFAVDSMGGKHHLVALSMTKQYQTGGRMISTTRRPGMASVQLCTFYEGAKDGLQAQSACVSHEPGALLHGCPSIVAFH